MYIIYIIYINKIIKKKLKKNGGPPPSESTGGGPPGPLVCWGPSGGVGVGLGGFFIIFYLYIIYYIYNIYCIRNQIILYEIAFL